MTQSPDKKQIRIFPCLADLSHEAAELFIKLSAPAIQERGRFSIALTGGSTPRTLYSLLASPEFKERISWPDIHLFWGDERCVPPSHSDSNYKIVQEVLLSKIRIPPENIHRMPGEINPAQGADQYEEEVRGFFATQDIPRFDLILLGLGRDGHIASLFPFSPALKETRRLVVSSYSQEMKNHRLTLTLPIINRARTILFMASGDGKTEILSRVFGDQRDIDRIPAQGVHPEKSVLYWYLDEAAAGGLT